jgi:hypothetical protein
MEIKLVDHKRNELLGFKVEIDKYMYIVATDVKNEKYNYLNYRINKVRKEKMYTYLNYKEYGEPEEAYTALENNIMDEVKNIIETEIHKLNEEQGVKLYLVRIEEEGD